MVKLQFGPYHGILCSNKKEQAMDTCNNLDGPQRNYGWGGGEGGESHS